MIPPTVPPPRAPPRAPCNTGLEIFSPCIATESPDAAQEPIAPPTAPETAPKTAPCTGSSPDNQELVAPTTAPPATQPPNSGYRAAQPANAPAPNAADPLPSTSQKSPFILPW